MSSEVASLHDRLAARRRQERGRCPGGYVNLDEVSRLSGVKKPALYWRCRQGLVPGARKWRTDGREFWIVPAGTVPDIDRRIRTSNHVKAARGEFGKTLRQLRLGRGLRHVDVAEMVGVGKSTVSSWELGELPDPPYIPRIAQLFDLEPFDELMLFRAVARQIEARETWIGRKKPR